MDSLFIDLLEERVQVVTLEGQELHFFFALLEIDLLALFVANLECFDSFLELKHAILLAFLFVLELGDLVHKSLLAMLSLELFAHGKGN